MFDSKVDLLDFLYNFVTKTYLLPRVITHLSCPQFYHGEIG